MHLSHKVKNLAIFLTEAIITVTAPEAARETEPGVDFRYLILIALGIILIAIGYTIKRKSNPALKNKISANSGRLARNFAPLKCHIPSSTIGTRISQFIYEI